MSPGLTADPPSSDLRSQPDTPLRAHVGDSLITEDSGVAGIPRIGEIVGVASLDGSPPYRVRWLAGEYESLVFPGPGARIKKRR